MSTNEGVQRLSDKPITTNKSNKRGLRRILFALLAVATIAGTAYFIANPVDIGAGFSDSEDGTVEASVGTVKVNISDENEIVDLAYPAMGTDDPKSDVFTVTNDGTLDYRASISDADVVDSSGDPTGAEDAFQVKIEVDPEQDGTYVTELPWTTFSSLPAAVTLGDLAPGESAAVKISLKLDGANTPNSLQGAEIDGTFTVSGQEL